MKVYRHEQTDAEKKRSGKSRYNRAKGLAFQDKIADELAKALPDYHVSVGKQAGKSGKGNPDVRAAGPDFTFHIEAKTGKAISIDAAFDQAISDSRGTDIPVVWRHRINGRTLVCMDPDDFIAVLQARELGQAWVKVICGPGVRPDVSTEDPQ